MKIALPHSHTTVFPYNKYWNANDPAIATEVKVPLFTPHSLCQDFEEGKDQVGHDENNKTRSKARKQIAYPTHS